MTEAKDQAGNTQDTDQLDVIAKDRRSQFEEHIRRWRSGGLSQAEYCRRNELKWSTFHYWRKRLATPTGAVTLVQVPVGFNGEGSGPSGQGLSLLLGDRYRVEIGDNFNPNTLAKLVDTLERL